MVKKSCVWISITLPFYFHLSSPLMLNNYCNAIVVQYLVFNGPRTKQYSLRDIDVYLNFFFIICLFIILLLLLLLICSTFRSVTLKFGKSSFLFIFWSKTIVFVRTKFMRIYDGLYGIAFLFLVRWGETLDLEGSRQSSLKIASSKTECYRLSVQSFSFYVVFNRRCAIIKKHYKVQNVFSSCKLSER